MEAINNGRLGADGHNNKGGNDGNYHGNKYYRNKNNSYGDGNNN